MFEGIAAEALLAEVRSHDHAADDLGASRIDAVVALDRLIRVAQAEQLDQIQALIADRSRDVETSTAITSVIGEVSMARNVSASAVGTQVATAAAMQVLPEVADRFRHGAVPEAAVRAVSRETQSLDPADLEVADAEIASRMVGLTARRAGELAARVVIGLDADAAHERATRERSEAYVSFSPEPHGVAALYVRGPAEQVLAAYEALDSWATGSRSAGDPRTRGQIMSETLVERVTGLRHADTIDVELNVVVDAKMLTGADAEAAELAGFGPIAPDVADEILARAHHRSIRRLFTDPIDHTLVGRDARRRRFDGPLAGHVKARDRRCRRPGCDCRIRDLDHVLDFERGGPTVAENAQSLCKRSHTFKHLPGWDVTTQGKATVWTTPTGHRYRSEPPALLGHLRQ